MAKTRKTADRGSARLITLKPDDHAGIANALGWRAATAK